MKVPCSALLLVLALLLSACGQTGPLYHPEQKPAEQDSEQSTAGAK